MRPPRGRRPRPHAAGAGGTDSRTPAAERLRIRRAVRGSPWDVPADSAPRLGLGLPQAPWVTSRRCPRGAGQGEGGREAVWERATREACGSTRCPLPRPPLPRPSSVRNQESRGRWGHRRVSVRAARRARELHVGLGAGEHPQGALEACGGAGV